MKYHILIYDEDIISSEITQKYIELFCKKNGIIVSIHSFLKYDSAMELFIQKHTIDMAYLDILPNSMHGIQIAKKLQKNHPNAIIMFLSYFTEYPLDVLDLLPHGLIRKPIEPAKFQILFDRAIKQLNTQPSLPREDFLTLIVKKKSLKIRQSLIIYAEKVQHRTQIKTLKGVFEVYDSISSIEQKLNKQFLRINQSVIVNRNEILALDRNTIYLSTGEYFIIGRTYLSKIKSIYFVADNKNI